MTRDGVRVNAQIKIDRRALEWFQTNAPNKLRVARKRAVEAAGMVWADETKQITRDEDHIDTGLYINSIGYATGTPNNPLFELEEGHSSTTLKIGADVQYAESLEKRYSIMARGLDRAETRMRRVTETQVKNTLFGG